MRYGGLDKTRYNTIHQWNLRNWVKSGVCDNCKAMDRKTYWSNKSGKYLHKVRLDWQELCNPCHRAYDFEVLGSFHGIVKGTKLKKGEYNPVRGFATMPKSKVRQAGQKGRASRGLSS